MSEPADLLVRNAAEVVTCAGPPGPRRGRHQGELGLVRRGAVAVRAGRVVAVGPEGELTARFRAAQTVDAGGGVVLPGFVDPHTHLVFGGDRAAEWEERMQGVPYLELLRRGGGILSTVRATRAASDEQLLAGGRRFLALAVEHGTTLLEAKSGYGLDRATELRLLRVAATLAREAPIELVSTFLGAHVMPPEHRADREGWLAELEALHLVVRDQRLAEWVDVFCEEEAYTLEETRRLLTHARGLGLQLKVHAEQFTPSGAAALAAELGATSVDHLEHLADASLAALVAAEGRTVAVLLPGAPFHLAMDVHAPARRLIDAGVPVALATDLNPGSSFTPSVPMCLGLACRTLRLTVAEAIVACTVNAAHALDRGAETGSLEVGKRADLIVCDLPDHRWLGYAFGWNPVRTVVAGGRVVHGG